MKAIKMMSVLGMLIGLLAVSAQAQSVQSDYDRTFNFSNLKNFGFAIQRRAAKDPLAGDTLNDGRIRTAIESELLANGYRMETEKADFAIAYYVTTKNKKPQASADSLSTPSWVRKLTKNASRTARPLIVKGTRMTRKSSGPIT